MKRTAICILAASAALSSWAQGPNDKAEVVGKLVDVEGLVTVSQGNQLANALNNAPLVKDSRIITTSSGRVKLVFNNGCEIVLQPNRLLVVDDGRNCAALLASARPVGVPAQSAPVAGVGAAPALSVFGAEVVIVYVIVKQMDQRLSRS